MNWQKKKPTKAGWYVTKNGKAPKGSQYHIVEVYYNKKNLVAKPEGYAETPLSEIKNTEFEWLLLEEV